MNLETIDKLRAVGESCTTLEHQLIFIKLMDLAVKNGHIDYDVQSNLYEKYVMASNLPNQNQIPYCVIDRINNLVEEAKSF